MAAQIMTFGQGDDNLGTRTERFKGEAGRKYRVSFAWFPLVEEGEDEGLPMLTEGYDHPQAGKPIFTYKNRVYIDGVGYVEASHPDIARYSKDGKAPRTMIGTVIVEWPTNVAGKVDQQRFKDGEYKVKPWIISEDKYRTLANIAEEDPFGENDLKIECSDTQFQKMAFFRAKQGLLLALMKTDKGKDIVRKIMSEVKAVAKDLPDSIGRKVSVEQIRAKLSGGDNAAQAVMDVAAGGDIDDLVDGLLLDD